MSEKVRAHIFVLGKVQGVFFREKTKKKAEELSVSGWVKNLKDGRVEAVCEGERENIEKLVRWAEKGPIFATVKDVDVKFEEYQGEFNNFEVRYDIGLDD